MVYVVRMGGQGRGREIIQTIRNGILVESRKGDKRLRVQGSERVL